MSRNPPLPVVCALIEREGRVLLARRPPPKPQALKWEFPGGKVDRGETAEAALIREIREEFGCDITIERPLPRSRHTYDHRTIEMIPFVCRLSPGSPEPHPIEHSAVAWVRPPELLGFDLAEADLPVARAYLRPDAKGPWGVSHRPPCFPTVHATASPQTRPKGR